jgi:hypothetical protein
LVARVCVWMTEYSLLGVSSFIMIMVVIVSAGEIERG